MTRPHKGESADSFSCQSSSTLGRREVVAFENHQSCLSPLVPDSDYIVTPVNKVEKSFKSFFSATVRCFLQSVFFCKLAIVRDEDAIKNVNALTIRLHVRGCQFHWLSDKMRKRGTHFDVQIRCDNVSYGNYSCLTEDLVGLEMRLLWQCEQNTL